ncbi:MAG: tripartite tricarboxylate transporter substrate-binding protein, partial [Advenella sp.]
VYGVSSIKRMSIPALTTVPTLDEARLSGFNFSVWHGLYAPKGTPRPIIDKINAALRVALKNPELIKRQEALGISIVNDDRLSSEGHRAFFEKEAARWAGVIKQAGIQPE